MCSRIDHDYSARLLGLTTYPLYLLHELVGAAMFGWLHRQGINKHAALLAAFTFVMLTSVGIAKYLEPPLERIIKNQTDIIAGQRRRIKRFTFALWLRAVLRFWSRWSGVGAAAENRSDEQPLIPALSLITERSQYGGLRCACGRRTWIGKGDNDRAIADYTEAIRLDPKNAAAFNNRCMARALAGQLEQALEDCETSLTLRPSESPSSGQPSAGPSQTKRFQKGNRRL